MNLGFDPWIPVMCRNGEQRMASLADVFADDGDFVDLAVMAHERIALMRLLVCVAQAALEGPEDESGWDEAPQRLKKKMPGYLERWRGGFELFGEGPRFMQIKEEGMAEFEISKLVFNRACGNNATVFDNEGGWDGRTLTPPEMALALLCYQNMSTPITGGYTGKPPCLDRNFLQTWLIGENLLESIVANGVDVESLQGQCVGGLGVPIWQMGIDFGDEAILENVQHSFLGRMAPVARRVWLKEDGSGFLIAKPGIKFPVFEEYRESAATVVVNEKKKERYLLGTTLGKSPWRDLQNVLRVKSDSGGASPLPLQRMQPVFKKLWLGALVTKDGKAKYEDLVESVYDVPRKLIGRENEDHRAVYAEGVEYAGRCALFLKNAVAEYLKKLKVEPDRVKKVQALAERSFWDGMDQRVPLLFDAVKAFGTDTFLGSKEAWQKTCERMAQHAYRMTCAKDTPRQMEAYALGGGKLRFIKKKETK